MWVLIAIQLIVAILIVPDAWATDISRTEIVEIDDSTEVTISVYSGPGDFLILWAPPEYGVEIPETNLAEYLGAGRNEVWIPDFLGARFLPPAPSSLRSLPAEDVATVIENAGVRTGKTVFLVSVDRGAGLALRGAMAWRVRNPTSNVLGGAILWHPKLYARLPKPGNDAEYIGEVSRIKLPIFIFQPKLSPGRWRLNRLISAFEAGKSLIFTKLVPGVRDRFFISSDANQREDNMATMVYELQNMAISQLQQAKQRGQ